MGPEVFGQYVFAFTVLSLLALPTGAAFGQLVMREVATVRHSQSIASKGLYSSMLAMGDFSFLAFDPSANSG